MKVVLAALNAKYVHSNLAVHDLEAYARERWHMEFGSELPFELAVREYTINHNLDQILQSLYREFHGTGLASASHRGLQGAGQKPLAAFSCYIWNVSEILSVCRDLKKVAPELSIWLGGPEVSYDSEQVLTNHPYIDGIMQGEGEVTFYELVKAFALQADCGSAVENLQTGEIQTGRENMGDGQGNGMLTGSKHVGDGHGKEGKTIPKPIGDGQGKETQTGSERDEDGQWKESQTGSEKPRIGQLDGKHGEPIEEALRRIRGIVYRSGDGRIARNPCRPLLPMDELPFIYSDLSGFVNKILYYESSRGCPFSCSYCLSSIDKSVRFRSLPLVKEELEFFLRNRVRQVKFIDRTFNCDRRRALEIWSFLKEHDNGVTNFHFEVAADLIGEEELAVFSRMRPGLIQLEIGLQTINAVTLKEIRRVMDIEKLKRNLLAIRRMGNIHQHLDLIAGLPYEDYASFVESFNAACAMRPNQLQLGFLKVLKGSHMEKMAQEYGLVYREEQPYEVLSTRWISYGELLRLKQIEEMVEVYYNSDQFEHVLPFMESFFETPFAMYAYIGAYYESHGFSEIGCRRETRYVILRDCFFEYLRSRAGKNSWKAESIVTGDDRIGLTDGKELSEESDVVTAGKGMPGESENRMAGKELPEKGDVRMAGKELPEKDDARMADKELPGESGGLKDGRLFSGEETILVFDSLLTFDYYLRENAKSRPAWRKESLIGKDEYVRFFRSGGTEELPLAGEGYDSKAAARGMHIEPVATAAVRWIVDAESRDRSDEAEADTGAIRKRVPEQMDRQGGRVVRCAAGTGSEKDKSQQVYAVFDYEHRNALTGDAGFTLISHL